MIQTGPVFIFCFVFQYPRLSASFQARQEEMMFQYRCNKLQHKMKQSSVAQQSLKVAQENLKFHGQGQDLSALQKVI